MRSKNIITVLSGGVGGARFLEGLIQVIAPEEIIVICNTGDDKEFYGLYVSPDIDIVMYTLAGIVNSNQGWGIADDTYCTMKQLTAYGNEDWFMLSDRDLATHIHRTNLLNQGKTLTEITDHLRKKLGIQTKLLPMSNQSVETHIRTPRGLIHFEEYLVKYHASDLVEDIVYVGVDKAQATPEVIEAINKANVIIFAPSNPLVSIGSILAVRGMKEAIKKTSAKVVAISPIIGGKPVKGPADVLLRGMHMEVSATEVAKYYHDLIDIFIIDTRDLSQKETIQKLGIQAIVTNTLMTDPDAKKKLALKTIDAIFHE